MEDIYSLPPSEQAKWRYILWCAHFSRVIAKSAPSSCRFLNSTTQIGLDALAPKNAKPILMAIKMFEEEGERHAEACRKEFWERADAIAADWRALTRAADKFIPVRNKWIAHFKLFYDPSAKEYKPTDLPSLQDVYFTFEAIVPTITGTISHLAGLFENPDISTDQFAEFAKRDASAFWEISESAT